MSLDVHLMGPEYETDCTCYCGHRHVTKNREEFYSSNITHNLGEMASVAGLYGPLWRPDEVGIATAAQLIAPLEAGLALLVASPEKFKRYNAANGWGLYEHFVPFVRAYLEACKAHPDAFVSVSR